jgi:5'-nucleotidase
MSHKARLLLCAFLAATLLLIAAVPVCRVQPKPVDIQILAFNDFHGALDVGTGKTDGVVSGGAEYLATHIKNLKAQNPKNTIVVSAGDSIGASPLLSAIFHDEPTILAMNLMGVKYSAVGNHEFDEGKAELLRMQYGGCNPTDGCYTDKVFPGARFKYLAANVYDISKRHEKLLFQPFAIQRFGAARVAFIGVSLETTPDIVTKSGVAGLKFTKEIDSINATVKMLKRMWVKSIVVLLHDGGTKTGTVNDCTDLTGSFVDVVKNTDPEIDVFVTGHSHIGYVCNVDGRLVTSAYYNGRVLTDITMSVDPIKDQVVAKSAKNIIVTQDVAKDADMTALLDKYRTLSAPIAGRVVGSITADITRTQNAAGESALGDVIADGQLAATSAAASGGAVIAMTNPGGIRTDLIYAPSGTEQPGEVTYGEAFAVQPFNNYMVTLTLTGDQLKAVLEQQATTGKVLQISKSLTYTWTASAAAGSKVSSIAINGAPVDPAAAYRVTVNNFLADGGDGFSAFTVGTDRLVGGLDIDAFVNYLGANAPVAPGPQNRITYVP